jgi:phosphatidylethanolamine-binding protein (PEBP) family uncharacterized protein
MFSIRLLSIASLGLASACSAKEEPAGTWAISSPVIEQGGAVPVEHTCEGRAFPMPAMGNPQLDWTEGPEGTQSYAIVVKHLAISENTAPTDPTYPRGFMWAIWDIPASVLSLPSNLPRDQFPEQVPGAQQWANFNQFGFFAPCPNFMDFEAKAADPSLRVTDEYGFALYAVSTPKLSLPPRPSDVTNYTMTLVMHLDANNLGMVQLNATSDALPISFTPPDVAALQYPAGVTTTTAMYPMPTATAMPTASTPVPTTPDVAGAGTVTP